MCFLHKLKMRKLLVLYEYPSDCHKNLDTGSFDLDEQLLLNKGSRLHLNKMSKLHSEVTDRQIKQFDWLMHCDRHCRFVL